MVPWPRRHVAVSEKIMRSPEYDADIAQIDKLLAEAEDGSQFALAEFAIGPLERESGQKRTVVSVVFECKLSQVANRRRHILRNRLCKQCLGPSGRALSQPPAIIRDHCHNVLSFPLRPTLFSPSQQCRR